MCAKVTIFKCVLIINFIFDGFNQKWIIDPKISCWNKKEYKKKKNTISIFFCFREVKKLKIELDDGCLDDPNEK